MQNTTQSPFCNAAIAYATRGFAVFPCVPRGKVPATPHGCRDATQDLAQITIWWARTLTTTSLLRPGRLAGFLFWTSMG